MSLKVKRSVRGIPHILLSVFDLDHEPEAERNFSAGYGLVCLDAFHALSAPGAFGLGAVAVRVEFCHICRSVTQV